MATRVEVLQSMVGRLYSMKEGVTKRSDEVDLHLLSVIILLSTRGDILDEAYPQGKPSNPGALYALGVDQTRATPEMIDSLRSFRNVFAGVQVAWLDLSGYTDPPCPPNAQVMKLVEYTKTLSKK